MTSCEKQKGGAIDPNYSSPFLFSIGLTPSSLNLDFDTTGSVASLGNNNYQISLHLEGKALKQFSIPELRGMLQVYKPHATSPFLRLSLPLNISGGDTIVLAAPVMITIRRSDVGLLRFDLSIITASDQSSNTIEKTLYVTRRNSRPKLSNLVAPDTLLRPTSGNKFILLTLAASDSDGYSDINEVFLKRILPSQTGAIDMFDDGDEVATGDKIAGDGIFSRILRIDSTAILGDQTFLFQALDNSSALSDSLVHTITISE